MAAVARFQVNFQRRALRAGLDDAKHLVFLSPEPGILVGGGAGDACLSCTSEGDKLSWREQPGTRPVESDDTMQ